MHFLRLLILSLSIASISAPTQGFAQHVSPGCTLAVNWEWCKEEWERIGLSAQRLKLVVDLATDAYVPYNQSKDGQKSIPNAPLTLPDKNDSSRTQVYTSGEKQNAFVFNGITGTYSNRLNSPLGFVYYQPSELEKALLADPLLAQEMSTEDLLENYNTHRVIAVAFRGTRHHLYDLFLTDMSARKIAAPDGSGRSPNRSFSSLLSGFFRNSPEVHSGFLATFESAFPQIQVYMKDMLYGNIASLPGLNSALFNQIMRDTEVIVTGHSMGGALAQIAGYVIGQRPDLSPSKPTVYTFSQPKVGNKTFIQHIDTYGVQVFRLHRETDVIPMVPGLLPNHIWDYEHSNLQLVVQDLPEAQNFWGFTKVMARHTMKKLGPELKAIASKVRDQIMDGIDQIVEDLASDLGFISVDADEVRAEEAQRENHLTESVIQSSDVSSVQKPEKSQTIGGRVKSFFNQYFKNSSK